MFETPELITITEVSQRLRVTSNVIYKLVHAGELPAIRLGSKGTESLRVRRVDLDAYLEAHRLPATQGDRAAV